MLGFVVITEQAAQATPSGADQLNSALRIETPVTEAPPPTNGATSRLMTTLK